MTATSKAAIHYLEQFRERQPELSGQGLVWLDGLRRNALEHLAATGFPTLRDEAWKYTNVSSITGQVFTPAAPGAEVSDRALLESLLQPGLEGPRLVFVNGHYQPELSNLPGLGEGVRVRPLAAVLAEKGESLRPHLAWLPEDGSGFTALNTAFMTDGACIELAPGARIEEPLHLVFVGGEGALASPRNLIIAGAGSFATVLEEYVGPEGGRYLTNTHTRVSLAEKAQLVHYRLNRESLRAFHVGELRIRQAAGSRLVSTAVALGGLISRTEVQVDFSGEGAETRLNGLYVADGRQHTDHHLHIDHRLPGCTSEQFYKGVLDGAARGVFSGRVVVHPDAQHTDARQSNKSLLLSRNAEMDARPQLEIYADDVKCAHGATVGQLDRDALYYLRARGVGEAEARRLLIHAFVGDVLARIPLLPLRQVLERLLWARLDRQEAAGA